MEVHRRFSSAAVQWWFLWGTSQMVQQWRCASVFSVWRGHWCATCRSSEQRSAQSMTDGGAQTEYAMCRFSHTSGDVSPYCLPAGHHPTTYTTGSMTTFDTTSPLCTHTQDRRVIELEMLKQPPKKQKEKNVLLYPVSVFVVLRFHNSGSDR